MCLYTLGQVGGLSAFFTKQGISRMCVIMDDEGKNCKGKWQERERAKSSEDPELSWVSWGK